MMTRRYGIVLVELLVAVMVVVLTALVAAPVVRDRIAKAGETHTFDNFRAIHTAFGLYLTDWGYYPVAHNLHNGSYNWEPRAYHTNRDAAEPYWWESLASYVWDPLVFKDPMDTGVGESYGQGYDSMYDYWLDKLSQSPWDRTNNMSCSYVYNGALGWVDYWQMWQRGQRSNWRPDVGTNHHYRTLKSNGGGPSPKTYESIVRPDARHLVWGWIGFWWRVRPGGYSGAWPVLFCDGHIKMIHWHAFDETGWNLAESQILVSWYVPPESDLAP
jgi:type II secretory pathway pseudopilin PulG